MENKGWLVVTISKIKKSSCCGLQLKFKGRVKETSLLQSSFSYHALQSQTPSLLKGNGKSSYTCRQIVQYTAYPVVEKDHQKAKAEENNQSHEQKSTHHSEVILLRTDHI